jgi:hypothetical protein
VDHGLCQRTAQLIGKLQQPVAQTLRVPDPVVQRLDRQERLAADIAANRGERRQSGLKNLSWVRLTQDSSLISWRQEFDPLTRNQSYSLVKAEVYREDCRTAKLYIRKPRMLRIQKAVPTVRTIDENTRDTKYKGPFGCNPRVPPSSGLR